MLEQVKNSAISTISSLGRGALHALAPNDFEYYACTFELINSQGIIEEIFHFPVMPTEISDSRQSLVNTQKAGNSYISQFNDSFASSNISISGTFGRKFRLLLTKGVGSSVDGKPSLFKNFDLKVKTGYGALKLMEKLVKSSQSLDEFGNPKILIFYNYSLNHNHVVEVMNFQQKQSLENNMLWNYSIEMKSLANVDDLFFGDNMKKHLVELLSTNAISKGINKMIGNISLSEL